LSPVTTSSLRCKKTLRRSKLYVFGEAMLDKGSGKKSWLERGIGEVKLLK
jgi:hypothetical protein